MVFVAAGVRRSASTLVFQIACELVGVDYRIRHWRERPKNIYSPNQWWVAKSHSFLPEAVSELGYGKIIAYPTIRDPRDIAVSMMTLHDNTFEEVMKHGIIQRDILEFNMWSDKLKIGENCFRDRYEDFYNDLPGLILSIATTMDYAGAGTKRVRPENDVVAVLAEKFSFENNKARSDAIGKSEEDLLFPGHLQTGGVGMWKDVLTKEQAKELEFDIGPEWFHYWGYGDMNDYYI